MKAIILGIAAALTIAAKQRAEALAFQFPEFKIFSISNPETVFNGPTAPSQFTFDRNQYITKIRNYHWNDAQGATPGTIWLLDSQGQIAYGPWLAYGLPGQGGVPDAYWEVEVNFNLPAGTYRVMDSDPSTWSRNDQSGGRGMVWLFSTGSVTVHEPPGAGESLTVGSIAWRTDGDPRQAPALFVPAAPSAALEATIEIPTDALRGGVHHVGFAGCLSSDGDPANFGFMHQITFLRTPILPDESSEVASIRWTVDGDPRSAGSTFTPATPGLAVEATIQVPTTGLRQGAHRFIAAGAGPSGQVGPIFAVPFLTVDSPVLAISALTAEVYDSAGRKAAGPRSESVPAGTTVFDGSFEWPEFRLRQSGIYQVVLTAMSEAGVPGRNATGEFIHSIPPFVEAIYADYWPPESFPPGDLAFVGDANRDGIPNGLAFALGVPPSASASGVLPGAMAAGNWLHFSFRQRSGGSGIPGGGYSVDGIRYQVESSPDLGDTPWTSEGFEVVGAPIPNPDGSETVNVRIPKPPQGSLFVRLKVEPAAE